MGVYYMDGWADVGGILHRWVGRCGGILHGRVGRHGVYYIDGWADVGGCYIDGWAEVVVITYKHNWA